MSVTPSHLRPGNWIYPTGRSKYVVVTGLLLGMMEKNEDFCKEFEGIELTGELLEAAGFKKAGDFDNGSVDFYSNGKIKVQINNLSDSENKWVCVWGEPNNVKSQIDIKVNHLHQLQQLYLLITGYELPLPESALIIPLVTKP